MGTKGKTTKRLRTTGASSKGGISSWKPRLGKGGNYIEKYLFLLIEEQGENVLTFSQTERERGRNLITAGQEKFKH